MIAAQIALEQLRQRDRLLSTENEMFKIEIGNHKKKVIELEAEVTKLSGQQNLQQRIHHHTKIKEENNALKAQNEELGRKLKRSDDILNRVKEELANLRAAHGKNAYYVETELQLVENLKETEEERDQLAQKLAALCTSILKEWATFGPDCMMKASRKAYVEAYARSMIREVRGRRHSESRIRWVLLTFWSMCRKGANFGYVFGFSLCLLC